MIIDATKTIVIMSGPKDCEVFSGIEVFSGKRTQRAILSRLTRERCHGDRIARAVQYSHDNEWGSVGRDLETDQWCGYPEIGSHNR